MYRFPSYIPMYGNSTQMGCEMLHSPIQGVNPQGRLYGRNISNHASEHPHSRFITLQIEV